MRARGKDQFFSGHTRIAYVQGQKQNGLTQPQEDLGTARKKVPIQNEASGQTVRGQATSQDQEGRWAVWRRSSGWYRRPNHGEISVKGQDTHIGS